YLFKHCTTFCFAEPPASVTKSVWVWAGNTTVLRCLHDPKDSLIMVTWKVPLLYNSHCSLSLSWENLTKNNCSERMRQENTSLRIENTAVTDQGNYSCEIVTALGTFLTSVLLEVLVQPSVTLELNKLGVPECRAHGGNPAANMWWTPEAVGSISTNTAMQPDRSWTVTSTYTVTSNNVTQVTCLVSHPTFVQPHVSSIRISSSLGLSLFLYELN
ncbi:cell surface glycoprotein CD200 receptor 1, partial [Xenopus laevis]|uniref:Cell surface glycoprotein CD200 receptor 1 n=1 Tax=Xenopus laevis TaxID=8355 RepID=A0A8J0UBG2_XENLA